MITQGLSHYELSLITKILDEHHVEYHVDAAGGKEDVKVRGGRGDTNFYQIEIPAEQYEKLPALARQKLENLGIYPEMDAPDFSEMKSETYVPSDATQVRQKFKKFERILMMVFVIMISLGFLYSGMN